MGNIGDQKMWALLKRLKHATENRQLEWSETDREHAYIARLGESSILVATQDDDGQAPWVLQVMNNSGDVIDSLSSRWRTERNHDNKAIRVPVEWNQPLSELHEMAQRQARNVDQVLDDLIGRLPDPDEPPF